MNYFIKLMLIFISTVAYASPYFGPGELTDFAKQYLSARSVKEQISVVALSAQTPDNFYYSAYAALFPSKNRLEDKLFQIGSLTKSFIAVIILQLENDPGYHFDINQSITVYFPEYKKWNNVRIKNLLNMTSGIPDFLDSPYFFEKFAEHPYRHQAIQPWLNSMYERNLLFQPGTQFHYSNTNYFLLGFLIEKLTGHSLKFEMENRLIKPLNLKNTFYFDDRIAKHLQKRMVHGYQYQHEYANFVPLRTDVTQYTMSYAGPAAGIISTSVDIMKWVNALFQPGKILTENQLKKLTTLVSEKTGQPMKLLTQTDPQGFGLGIRAIYYPASKDSYVYAYEGLTLGYRAMYVYSPADKILVTATVNSNYHRKDQNYLFDLVDHVFQTIHLSQRILGA